MRKASRRSRRLRDAEVVVDARMVAASMSVAAVIWMGAGTDFTRRRVCRDEAGLHGASGPPSLHVRPARVMRGKWPVGTTVDWTNEDPFAHTVTARDGAFDSGTMDGGEVFSQTFEAPGTFEYFCAIHPSITGTVTVTP